MNAETVARCVSEGCADQAFRALEVSHCNRIAPMLQRMVNHHCQEPIDFIPLAYAAGYCFRIISVY